MKILRVINSLHIGGAERSIVGNVPLHIENGYEMDVLLLNGEATFFLEELKEKNVKIITLGVSNNIYNPLLLIKISKIIKDYDIVHAHLFPALYWVALARIFSSSKPKMIFTEHNTHNKRRDFFFFKYIDKLIYKQYEHIIAITPETNTNLSVHLERYNDITTIYNGVDLNKIKTEKNSFVKKLKEKLKGKKLLIQVASFRIQKDQDTLIRALRILPDDFHVLFVGDGQRLESCKNLAESLGVLERMNFLGLQNNVGAFLRLSDIVIMSSHWEGFGRTAIEGMAAGKPVIATNVSGLSDIVSNAGLLFEVGDYNKLANLILTLSKDKEYYNEIKMKCLKRSEKYSIQKMVNEYETIYKQLSSV
jgi:glycosyltransferase involved in cell wall biosynthesis